LHDHSDVGIIFDEAMRCHCALDRPGAFVLGFVAAVFFQVAVLLYATLTAEHPPPVVVDMTTPPQWQLRSSLPPYVSTHRHPYTLDDVTVIIKTRDRVRCCLELVDSLLRDDDDVRILVADDGTKRLSNASSRVRVIDLPVDTGLAAGRNAMVSLVSTPLVMLLDDDFRLEPGTIARFTCCAMAQ
jgi:hypothetical protein